MVTIEIDKDWKIVFNGLGVWELVKANRQGEKVKWCFISNSKHLWVVMQYMFRHRVSVVKEVMTRIEDINKLFERSMQEVKQAAESAIIPVAVYAENELLKERIMCLQDQLAIIEARGTQEQLTN